MLPVSQSFTAATDPNSVHGQRANKNSMPSQLIILAYTGRINLCALQRRAIKLRMTQTRENLKKNSGYVTPTKFLSLTNAKSGRQYISNIINENRGYQSWQNPN